MKKAFVSVVAVFCLVGCSQAAVDDEQFYAYTDKISSEQIQKVEVSAEFVYEYTPEYMQSISDSIVIGRIDTVRDADMKYNDVVGYTYGRLTVLHVLSGNLSVGEEIEYAKPGGVIEYSKWNATQPQADQEKRAYLLDKNNEQAPAYVDILLENDIHEEAGKSYLIYLKFSDDMNRYEVIGLGNGLREVIGLDRNTQDISSLEKLKIKNNTTNINEDLATYRKEHIK